MNTTETQEEIIETVTPATEDAESIDQAVELLRRPIEALLFVASESLTIKQIAKLTHAAEVEVAAALQQIEAEVERSQWVTEAVLTLSRPGAQALSPAAAAAAAAED